MISNSKENGLFHCKLHTLRCGADYGLNKKDFSGTIHVVFSSIGAPTFSVGGTEEDYIQVEGLEANHVACVLLDDALILKANGLFQLTTLQGQRNVKPGETINLAMKSKVTSSSINWKMIFANQTTIIGKVDKETENIDPKVQKYLESQYGPIEKYHRGRSCLVYKAQNDKILKILSPEYAKNRGPVRRFINAARKFQALPGEQFVNIEEIVYRNRHSLSYVLTEFFPGETLENYLIRKGILPLEQAKEIVKNLAQSLLILQKNGCCYRNLTPENILIDENGRLKITGFFLLKSEELRLTAPGAQMVIPKYSAPEQALDAASADILSDMFSLGAIFYSMLLGEPPFQFNNPREYLSFLKTAQVIRAEDLYEIAPKVPMEICELIASLLAFNKNNRPQPEEFLDQLFPGDKQYSASLQKLLEGDDDDEEPEMTPTFAALLAKVDREVPEPTARETESAYYCLTIISGPPGTQPLGYNFSGECTVSIGKQGDLRISNDPTVSRKHAQLEVTGKTFILNDLHSSNGTYINNERITRKEITPGTEFNVGDTLIYFNKVRTALSGIMENAQQEFSEEHMSNIHELRISNRS